MNEAKIRLSAKEAELVQNAEFILTKNAIIIKAKQLLESVMEEQLDLLRTARSIPIEIKSFAPKISKGENYQGLPYLILDHPRFFNLPDIFAIRTFFWWGHFFSVTLQLAGKYKSLYQTSILGSYDQLHKNEVSYCINEDPWEHHFEKHNYVLVSEINKTFFAEKIHDSSFIKLSKKYPLQHWNNATQLLTDDFKMFLEMIKISA
jgi:hypothetical protein